MNKAFQFRVGLTTMALLAVLLTLSLATRSDAIAQASPHNKALGLEQLNLLAEARSKRTLELVSQEGWLRQIAHYTNATTGGTLPNGKTIPMSYSIETWMFVIPSGEVKISVDIMRDGEGEVIQTGVTQNGRTRNENAGLDIPTPTLNLIEALSKDDLVTFQKSYGGDFTVKLTGDGKTTVTLILSDSQGGSVEGYEKLEISSKRASTYDTNGILIHQQVKVVFEDGSEAILNSVEIDPLEAINQPPTEVLKLLGE